MPQQVNLCLPILRQQKDQFSAKTLGQALVILLLASAALGAAWIWNLRHASDQLKVTLTAQAKEVENLRGAIERGKTSAGPAQAALAGELKDRKLLLQQREVLMTALSQGLFQPGQGHAARLQLVAQTIPAAAWVTNIKTDDQLLEVAGYTLEPAALNEWVGKLALSPLLHGQTLSTIKVESVKPDSVKAYSVVPRSESAMQPLATRPGGAVSAPLAARAPLPAVWSFSLLSRVAVPPAPGNPTGGRP